MGIRLGPCWVFVVGCSGHPLPLMGGGQWGLVCVLGGDLRAGVVFLGTRCWLMVAWMTLIIAGIPSL